MIWGMTLATFTEVHVALSLVAIAAGFVVMSGLLGGRDRGGWTALFLVTTVATNVTGFGFLARHGLRLRGAWRPVYVVGAALALYLNVFIGVVQAFLKVSALHALAPQQTEPPFLVAQLVVLALFIVLAVLATKRFRHESSTHVSARL